MLAWNDWLPDFKGALTGFYEESVKPTIEAKSSEYKTLLQTNMAHGQQIQKAVVAILLAVFLLLALAFFWTDPSRSIQWKYLLLGSLMGYVLLYVRDLKPQEFTQKILSN